MSEVAEQIIRNTLSERGGEAPEDVVLEAILERRDVKEETAEFYITNYAEKHEDDEGNVIVTLPEDENSASEQSTSVGGETAATSDTESVEPATTQEVQTVGRPTSETFSEAAVFEDVGHPMVPEGYDNYYRRRVAGKKTDVQLVTKALEKGHNVMLKGETGVGKDELAMHIGEERNQPVFQINFGKDTRVEDLVGHYELVDGNTRWVDGVLTRAVRSGGIFLADEINAAGGSVTMPLHSVTQKIESRYLTVPQTGETIVPHEAFRVIGTMNPQYAGTQRQNKAFQNRFVHISLDYISATREVEVVVDNTGLGDDRKNVIKGMVDVANDLRDDYKNGEIVTPVSTRELIQVADYIEEGWMDVEDAMKLVIGGIADENDQSAIEKKIETSNEI